MKKRVSTVILILVFLTGLSLLLYPTVSDYWNSLHQSRAIAGYTKAVAGMDQERYGRLLADARSYNEHLYRTGRGLTLPESERALYEAQLNISGSGMMGYVEIPSIGCSLPICHGTDEAVLQRAIGHIEGSSLPVGGESTHAVLSGHRGLPSARLFTDLDQLTAGDLFYIRILDETLTYEVDQIRIVEPHEVETLRISPGEDLCTLVTCTPYGVNSHRLLVRGRRVENGAGADATRVTADAVQIEPMLIAPLVALPILLVLLALLLAGTGKRTKK